MTSDDPIQQLVTYEDPLEKFLKHQDPIQKMLQDQDRMRTMLTGVDQFSRILHDPAIAGAMRAAQGISLMMEDSGVLKYAREMQRHAELIEAASGSKWMRDIARATDAIDFGIGRIAREAQRQMAALEDTGAFRFLRQAQEISKQFEVSGIAKTLAGLTSNSDFLAATAAAGNIARSLQGLSLQPHIAALMRGGLDNAAFYRQMGLDYVQMAGAAPVSASDPFWEANAALEEIEAAVASDKAQYDVAAVTRSFGRAVHALAAVIDGEGSSVERRAARKVLAFLLPILISLWIWHAQHIETLESQRSSDEAAAVAHQDALKTQRLIENLAARVAEEQARPSANQYYDVMRLVPLCEGPKYRGPHRFILMPGAEVELVERHQKWIEVCAIDPSGKPATGWVLKKYLIRQSR